MSWEFLIIFLILAIVGFAGCASINTYFEESKKENKSAAERASEKFFLGILNAFCLLLGLAGLIMFLLGLLSLLQKT